MLTLLLLFNVEKLSRGGFFGFWLWKKNGNVMMMMKQSLSYTERISREYEMNGNAMHQRTIMMMTNVNDHHDDDHHHLSQMKTL